MTLDEILQLAEEFEKKAAMGMPGELSPTAPEKPSLQDNMEHARKVAEIKVELTHIKRLSDLVEAKYKTAGKSSGLFKIFDSAYHKTLSGVKKARRELEELVILLDRKV